MAAFTKEQESYIGSVVGGHNTALFAYAGSGKTHATIEAVVRLHKAMPHRSILLVTYNVRIKQEIEAKLTKVFGTLPRSIAVRTMNSVGYGILMANRFSGNNELQTDAYKVNKMIREAVADKLVAKVLIAANKGTAKTRRRLDEHEVIQFLEEVIATAKLYGVRPESVDADTAKRLFESAGEKTGLPPDSLRIDANILKLITNLLLYNIDLARNGVIDFNDQIYLAALYCPSPGRQWATVIADEIQDFSGLFWMILKRVARNQLCAIGDPFQCIFRSVNGADTGPFERFAKESNVKRHELTRTFRCARVIAERQVEFGPLSKFVPHAGKKAPIGEVHYPYLGPKFPGFPKDIKNKTITAPWSFIDAAPSKRVGSIGFLAATNATLIEATALAVRDNPIFIRNMVYCGQTYPVSRWNLAADYISRPARAPSNLLSAMAMFMKLTDCTPKDAVEFFNSRKDEEYKPSKVVFSTVHSWKGRECDTIYLIEAAALNGDTNLKYVAETRARTKLCDLKLGWHVRANKNKWLSGYFVDTDRPVRAVSVKALLKSLRDGIPHKFKADEKTVMASIKKGEPPSFVDG